ncbi:MAG TPA: TonB family protein [Longimicrobiales bacterium]
MTIVALSPLPSDTPPARRVPPPEARELRAVNDVVLTARMANGAPAPSTIVLPQLRNRVDVIDYIRKNHPDSIAAIPSIIPVAWVYVDESGKTHVPEIIVSSGSAPFDKLAIEAVRRAQFAPALIDTFKVALWVMLPVQVGGLAARPAPCRDEAPCFTPYTVKPTLRNRDAVARTLVQNYPSDLRDQKVRGTTLLWLLVDEIGHVQKAQVKQSSGVPKLDQAALQVAQSMLFTPALNRDLPVKVWIQLPIVFQPN